MRRLFTCLALTSVLAAAAGSADGRRARKPEPSRAASIAARLESGLEALGGFEDSCRAAGAWMLAGKSWLQDLATFQARSGVLAGWAAAAATGADALLAVLDPAGRVPRLDLTPYRMMTVRPADGGSSSQFG